MARKASAVVFLLARLSLGGVFLVAGVGKALDPEAFVQDIETYHLLPFPMAIGVAFYLPYLEVLCGVCLIVGKSVKPAAALVTGLFLIFLAALVQAWVRGLDIRCGCFGLAQTTNYPWLIARDFVLGLVAGIVWWHSTRPEGRTVDPARLPTPGMDR